MATQYQKLMEQIEALQTQAQEARDKEVQGALDKIHDLIQTYGLSQRDVFPPRKGPKKGATVAPKYRDPATGTTWSGRGREPKWMQGKKREDFAI